MESSHEEFREGERAIERHQRDSHSELRPVNRQITLEEEREDYYGPSACTFKSMLNTHLFLITHPK